MIRHDGQFKTLGDVKRKIRGRIVKSRTARVYMYGSRVIHHSTRHLVTSFSLSCQCFAVRSLGWVEVPEEDLAPGKSSIAVNNCIQQLAQTRNRSQPHDGAWGEVSCLISPGGQPMPQQR